MISINRSVAVAVFLLIAGLSASSVAGPISELYLASKTEHGGGKSVFAVVQGTQVNRTWTARHGNELALAVSSTVRTLGLLNIRHYDDNLLDACIE